MPCRHPDIQKFDGVRCCLSCGEAVFDSPHREIDPVPNTSGEKYGYRPLDHKFGQEIRLVVLYPGQEKEDLMCEIKHVNLLDNPVYEALSYCWGDTTLSRHIFCRGRSVPITLNCEAALRCLRRRDRGRVIWIDAICIDQSNTTERNHQVRIMSSIYSSASQVLAFLGSQGSPQRNASVKRIAGYLDDSLESYNRRSHVEREDLLSFIDRPYWSRIWILQEIALAQLVTVVVEDQTIRWTGSVIETIRQLCHNHGVNHSGVLPWVPANRPEEQSLIDVLGRSRTCSATDPRDKVFAVLGLAQKKFSDAIPVDYTLHVNQVYLKVAVHYILDLRDLNVMKHTLGQPLDVESAPSWVPKWDLKIICELLLAQFKQERVRELALSWFGNDKSSLLFYTNRPAIPRFGRSEKDKCSDDFDFTICERQYTRSYSLGDFLYLPIEESVLLPCLVIRAHYLGKFVKLDPRIEEPHDLALLNLAQHTFSYAPPCSSCATHDAINSPCTPLSSVKASRVDKYKHWAWKFGAHNTFFQTEYSIGLMRNVTTILGRLGNVTMLGARPNMGIWLLAGADTPFVLSKVENHYVLLGECALYGAMDPLPCCCCGRDSEPWPTRTEIIDIC
jgi:hypothetical protein